MTALSFITPNWPAPKKVQAFSTLRAGGASQFPYDSFNVGAHVGDDNAAVLANRQRLPRYQHVKWLNQVHGNDCILLTPDSEQNQDADATTTTYSGLVCAVMSADCLPILLCNNQGTEVAAVHAGWKGLADGVIENSCKVMHSNPGNLLAWIGPHISQKNYEVNETVLKHFDQYTHCFTKGLSKGKYQVDLQTIALEKLTAIGITNVYTADLCTYENDQQLFSHRRATHQGLADTGRMVSGIYLEP